jgi:hypothetical protein
MTKLLGTVASLLALGGLSFAAVARADDATDPDQTKPYLSASFSEGVIPPNCQEQPWGFLGSMVRAICDGPIQPDGSWMRHRVIGVPAHYEYPSSSCSGGVYSSYCTYYPGGWVDEVDTDNEIYPVTLETVLPDEPGHLG